MNLFYELMVDLKSVGSFLNFGEACSAMFKKLESLMGVGSRSSVSWGTNLIKVSSLNPGELIAAFDFYNTRDAGYYLGIIEDGEVILSKETISKAEARLKKAICEAVRRGLIVFGTANSLDLETMQCEELDTVSSGIGLAARTAKTNQVLSVKGFSQEEILEIQQARENGKIITNLLKKIF